MAFIFWQPTVVPGKLPSDVGTRGGHSAVLWFFLCSHTQLRRNYLYTLLPESSIGSWNWNWITPWRFCSSTYLVMDHTPPEMPPRYFWLIAFLQPLLKLFQWWCCTVILYMVVEPKFELCLLVWLWIRTSHFGLSDVSRN